MKNSRTGLDLLILLTALFTSALTGCRKTEAPELGSMNSKKIAVRPYAYNTKGTVTTTLGLENKGRFVMEAYVDADYCDYNADPEGDHPFAAGKYIDRVSSGNVIYGGGIWSITPSANWVQGVNTTFWCWAPTTMTPIPAGMGAVPTTFDVYQYAAPYNSDQLRFDYARPGVATFPLLNPDGSLNANSEEFLDADIQDDIVLAYAKQNYNDNLGNDMVDLVFYHPLSQIRFAVSPDDGTFDSTLKIVQIAIKNIKQGGQCTFRGAEAGRAEKFVWDLNSSPMTSYCQTYDAEFQTVPDNWTNGTYTESANTYKLYTAQNVFFVTPQTVGAGAYIDILFEDKGTFIEVEKPLPADTWKPGYYYTYKIGATVLGRTIKLGISLIDWQNYDDKLFI